MFSSVRTRLTLWYAGVFGLILILFSIGVYAVSNATLHRRVAAALQSLGEAAAVSLEHETAEGESIQLAAKHGGRHQFAASGSHCRICGRRRWLATRGAISADACERRSRREAQPSPLPAIVLRCARWPLPTAATRSL